MWRLFKKYYFSKRTYRIRFVLLSILFLVSIALQLSLPYLSGCLIDHLDTFEKQQYPQSMVGLLFLSLSLIWVNHVKDKMSHLFRLEKIYILYSDCVKRLMETDYRKAETANKTFLNEQFISDSSNTLTFIINSAIPMVADAVRCLFVTIYFLQYELRFIWILSAYFPVCGIIFRYYKKRFSKVMRALLNEECNFYSRSTNHLNHVNFAMSNHLKKEYLGGFVDPVQRIEDAYRQYFSTDICYRTWMKCVNTFFLLILVIGHLSLESFHLSEPGNLVILFGFFSALSSSYGDILMQFRLWTDVNESRRRLECFEKDFPKKDKSPFSVENDVPFSAKKDACFSSNGKELTGISAEGLAFTYDGKRTLDYPAIRLKRGVNIIRGANGTGKTTLLKLLTGLYTKQRGEIHCISGEKGILDNRLPKYTYIPQEPDAFETALLLIRFCAVNLQKTAGNKDDAHLQFLANEMDISDIMKKISEGFNHSGGDWDALYSLVDRLSIGQRKKLMLLAGVGDPDAELIFLDEPENHLDSLS